MSEPEFDRDDPDAESMFDFLAEDGGLNSRQPKPAADKNERALPIIRKPVPVSESGPLLPPKPGDPVEPPPQLTTNSAKQELDLDFPPSDSHHRAALSRQASSRADEAAANNVTRMAARPQRPGRGSHEGVSDRRPAPAADRAVRDSHSVKNEFDSLGLDDDLDLDDDWHAGVGVGHHPAQVAERRSGRVRWLAMVVALLLIGAGVASFVTTGVPQWLKLPGSDSPVADQAPLDQSSDTDLAEVGSQEAPAVSYTPSPLMQRFRDEQARIEQLLASGALDEAESALATMDRTVYGYGAAEFSELENQIEQRRSGSVTSASGNDQTAEADAIRLAEEQAAREEALRVAEAQAAREEAARAAEAQAAREEAARVAEAQAAREEAARVAEAQAAREEAARVAEAQAAREEAARVADVQAAREEAARIADAQAAREEAARVAQAQAAREEAARVAEAQALRDEATQRAQEQAARIEQIRLAEQAARDEAARLEQSSSTAGPIASSSGSRTQSIDADRIATDRRIAEERAALQRQQAREQRLVEAREREAQAEQARAAALSAAETSTSQDTQSDVAAAGTDQTRQDSAAQDRQSISDSDLQLVYRRFVNLQNAISERDINAVVSLTERSGIRVQQLMQMFENSTEIDARIKNVSTSNATGEIKGTLQINRVRRANGSYANPPASLSSIALSSKRDENGWSAISW